MVDNGPATRHVALLIETSNAYARGLLRGVHRYVSARPGWSLYLVEHSRLESDFSWLQGWRGDGLIARIETEPMADFVRGLQLPAVDLSAAQLVPELPCAETDDEWIALLAAEHFAERGLRNFGFCSYDRFAWSRRRSEAFAQCVADLDAQCHVFTVKAPAPNATDRRGLARWIAEIPKPVGVLACYDLAGQEVLEACKIAGVRVPDEVAVVGVDNDELITTITSPPLSSIQPDSVRTGHLAAELLDNLMSGEYVPPGIRRVPPIRLVPRQSSDLLYTDDPLVKRALAFIRSNQDTGIAVRDVLQAVGSSRRALDQRFVAALGRTTHGEIMRVRMARVAELLLSTDLTVEQIAHRLDFAHAENLSVAFKREIGDSPGAYRRNALL